MKSVLISIRPEWCELIASGEKTLEVRKTRPKLETPFKAYIYCTLSGSNEFFKDVLNGDVAEWNRGKWDERKGNVIGEFTCDSIKKFDVPYPAYQNKLDPAILKESCCTYYQLHRYAYHDNLYGWHISDLKIYDKPKELSEFCGLRKTKFGLEPIRTEHPPQSWCYVEEV